MQRFLLLQVIDPHSHQDIALNNMHELELLVATYGGQVIEKSIQHRVHPHPAMYIGTGKVEWVKQVVKEKRIDVVLLNAIAKSSQIFRLEKTLWQVNRNIAVWDRVDLILHIFDQHATTTEAKLQIELARIQHLGPRIYGLGGGELSRQGAGIGTRGKGETNIEFEKRKIKKIKQRIEQQLKNKSSLQERRIELRKRLGIHTVALVGYTSAGKSTLFNALTSKTKVTNRGLFTTLESSVGKLKMRPYSPTVLLSDTIGFIDELPTFLIDAFRSTLVESLEAKLLLHVIDTSDHFIEKKIAVVQDILSQLGTTQETVFVFNKSDLVTDDVMKFLKSKFAHIPHYFLSAKTKQGIDQIHSLIKDRFELPV